MSKIVCQDPSSLAQASLSRSVEEKRADEEALR